MARVLFRQDALDARGQQKLGAVRIVSPLSQRYAMVCSLAFVVAVVATLVFGSYTRRVHVAGRLVPSAGLISISPRVQSTVSRVFVKEGQHVRRGEPVASVTTERTSESMGDTSAGVASTLRADQKRLTADMDTVRVQSRQQLDALRKQRAVVAGQLVHLDGQATIQRQQIALQETMLAKVEPLLAKGYISAFQVQQQQSTLLSSRADLESLARQRADIEQQLSGLDAQIADNPLQLASRLSELGGQVSNGQQALASAEAERSLVLLAPDAGTVSSVVLREGQSASSGQTVVSIIPEGSPLLAQFLVKSDASGFVRPGDRVALHLQAYPYQKFGIQKGTVKAVSQSALSPEQAMTLLGQPQVEQEPVYLVEVGMERQAIEAYGRNEQLHPGMMVDADILLDKRALYEWMFEPVLAAKQKWNGEHL